MGTIVDNLIAYRILNLLVTPFVNSEAYKLGIIDEKGTNLKRASSLKTQREKDSYTYLHRLVFNMKKILGKLPGGDSKLKNLVAALFLVKEHYYSGEELLEESVVSLVQKLDEGVFLVEEEIETRRFLSLMEDMGVAAVPSNNTSGAEVTEPKIYPSEVKKYRKLHRRKKPLNVGT